MTDTGVGGEKHGGHGGHGGQAIAMDGGGGGGGGTEQESYPE